jgi:hypothetical protein
MIDNISKTLEQQPSQRFNEPAGAFAGDGRKAEMMVATENLKIPDWRSTPPRSTNGATVAPEPRVRAI